MAHTAPCHRGVTAAAASLARLATSTLEHGLWVGAWSRCALEVAGAAVPKQVAATGGLAALAQAASTQHAPSSSAAQQCSSARLSTRVFLGSETFLMPVPTHHHRQQQARHTVWWWEQQGSIRPHPRTSTSTTPTPKNSSPAGVPFLWRMKRHLPSSWFRSPGRPTEFHARHRPRLEPRLYLYSGRRGTVLRTGTEYCGLRTDYLAGKLPMPADGWAHGRAVGRKTGTGVTERQLLPMPPHTHGTSTQSSGVETEGCRMRTLTLAQFGLPGRSAGRAETQHQHQARTKQGRRRRCGGYLSCTYTQYGRCAVGP
jgi:hypothetical protein